MDTIESVPTRRQMPQAPTNLGRQLAAGFVAGGPGGQDRIQGGREMATNPPSESSVPTAP